MNQGSLTQSSRSEPLLYLASGSLCQEGNNRDAPAEHILLGTIYSPTLGPLLAFHAHRQVFLGEWE